MQNRNSKGQFTSSKVKNLTTKNLGDYNRNIIVRFFGPINSLVWNLVNDYIVITNADITEAYIYYPDADKKFQLIASGIYTPETLAKRVISEKHFWLEKDFDKVESIFLQDYSVLVPRTWGEVKKIVAEQDRLENFEKSFQKKLEEQKQEVDLEFKKMNKLTIDSIKIGSLYYNLVYNVVERVIDIQGRLIYTSYHKMECNPFGVNSFRKATQEEVDNYLKESEEIKS